MVAKTVGCMGIHHMGACLNGQDPCTTLTGGIPFWSLDQSDLEVHYRSNQMWNNEFNKIKKKFNPYLFSVLELLDYSTDCFFIVILNYMKSLSIE